MSDPTRSPSVWRRPDVYAGLLFIGVAALGLYLAQDYAVGTAVRMGTGYVPRLLCWTMMALGCVILLQGLLARPSEDEAFSAKDKVVLRPLLFVSAATFVFAFTIERLGLIAALMQTILIGSIGCRSLRPLETAIAMVALTIACWAIFSYGLALPFPVWPRA